MEDKILDLSNAVPKSEISKNLLERISWQDMIRSGELKTSDHQLIEKSQNNLGVIVDNTSEGSAYVKLLLTMAHSSDLKVQQYSFSRIEEILGLGMQDYSDADMGAFGSKNSIYFTTQGHLNDISFLRALELPDKYIQKSASLSLASLLCAVDGSSSTTLLIWISTKLVSSDWDIALPALIALSKGSQTCKEKLVIAGMVNQVIAILKQLGRNGNAQQIYELTFVIWSLSLGTSGVEAFKSTGVVSTLVELLSSSPSRKVTRMTIAALRNLCETEDDDILTEMLGLGLLKVVETAKQSFKLVADTEAESDFKFVQDVLSHNYRELSTFERWVAEVRSGTLKWGILHTEKFWRENAKFVESNDFALLKELIALLHVSGSTQTVNVGNTPPSAFVDPVSVCVALFDIGEFTRFYPNGRVVVSKLGGKDLVMQMLQRSAVSPEADSPFHQADTGDAEIEKHSLQCISKLLVTNWEFLR